MTIVFAGHFTIGEKINETQLKTIAAAKKVKGDLAILVNDIDIKRKLQFFRIDGTMDREENAEPPRHFVRCRNIMKFQILSIGIFINQQAQN